MVSLQNAPSIHSFPSSFPQLPSQKPGTVHFGRRGTSPMIARAEQLSPSASTSSHSLDGNGRRQVLTAGVIAPCIYLFSQNSLSFAAENKKGYISVLDKKDGYSFLYPFGWQEVVIEGQDKVFKDVIEPLENVSVNLFPTSKTDIKDFGPPSQVAETLIKKVLAPPNQKTKLIGATEHDVEGKTYYMFEFIAQAPNYTRHALSAVSIGNGKFYTLSTGSNERRWDKMKDKLQTVVDSFKIFDV